MQDPVALEAASQFWATSLGVDEERLEGTGTIVVPSRTESSLRGIMVFRRRDRCILSIFHPEPADLVERVMEIGRRHSPEELLSKGPWKEIAAGVAPAATSFVVSRNRIPPQPKRGVRSLDSSNALQAFREGVDEDEWHRGGVDDLGLQLLGVHENRQLIAVGSVDAGSRRLGTMRIFVAREHRRKGLASSLASQLANHAATRVEALQMVPFKGDLAGEGLALALGFFPFGETTSVILKNSFQSL